MKPGVPSTAFWRGAAFFLLAPLINKLMHGVK